MKKFISQLKSRFKKTPTHLLEGTVTNVYPDKESIPLHYKPHVDFSLLKFPLLILSTYQGEYLLGVVKKKDLKKLRHIYVHARIQLQIGRAHV